MSIISKISGALLALYAHTSVFLFMAAAQGFTNPLQFDTISDFLEALLDVIILIGFPVVVIAIVWSGFLFVKAQGNETALKDAKNAIFWTLIGALLVLGAFALSQLVQGTVDEITLLSQHVS